VWHKALYRRSAGNRNFGNRTLSVIQEVPAFGPVTANSSTRLCDGIRVLWDLLGGFVPSQLNLISQLPRLCPMVVLHVAVQERVFSTCWW
jgi:hypothetical protein